MTDKVAQAKATAVDRVMQLNPHQLGSTHQLRILQARLPITLAGRLVVATVMAMKEVCLLLRNPSVRRVVGG